MIEDKKLGLKVAENPEIAAWHKVVESRKQTIQDTEIFLEIEKNVLAFANTKLREAERRVKK